MKVFGVKIDGGGFEEVFSRIRQSSGLVWVVTVNPEILLEARKNEDYMRALNSASYKTIDGVGLFLHCRYVLRRKCERLTGVDLSEQLLQEAEKQHWRVGCIGAGFPKRGVAEAAAKVVKERFPALIIHSEDGGIVSHTGEDDSGGEEARHRLTLFDPHVLLVAYGHPKQELWIRKYMKDFPHLRVIAGIGGTFDFWAGNAKRAPMFMRRAGLEWLFRLFHEPRRYKRIFRAVCVFPVLALWDALGKKKLARP